MMEWFYIIFVGMMGIKVTSCAFDENNPNAFIEFIIGCIIMLILFVCGGIMFPELFSEI